MTEVTAMWSRWPETPFGSNVMTFSGANSSNWAFMAWANWAYLITVGAADYFDVVVFSQFSNGATRPKRLIIRMGKYASNV
ncbi:MAG: hypothetical protein G01um101416_842 [Microgenomates group bacterium Gr01-1014_16]|nr:MAG: hypothetical protein G01um101416_842 [Microgenomates group bacterium Gr01-1014_16]